MSLSGEERAAIGEAVERRRAEMVAFLQALVRLATENPPGDTHEATEWVATTLEARGHSVTRIPVPDPFARHYGRSNVTNLLVRRTFGDGGPTIALAVPLDTLPAGAGWQRDPFAAEVKDDVLHGRGARDAKSDVAAYVTALEVVAEREGFSGTVEIHLTADEESGGFLGPAYLLSQDLSRPDAVIGSGTSYQVVTGQQGVLHLEVLLRGRQSHASRPHAGADALEAALPLLARLYEIRRTSPAPLTIGLIEGGRGVNLVPDRVRFTVDRRLSQGESGEHAETELTEMLAEAHEGGKVELECRRLLLADPVEPSEASNALGRTIADNAAAVFGRDIPIADAPVVSGTRHYAQAGIATALYGVGPPVVGEGADVASDEHVALDDLVRATCAIAATLIELMRR